MPVIAVVAPPGYGKTTLLAQFAARKGTRAAWVSADSGDDDPFVLLSYIVEAVARVAGPRSRVDGPPRLASAIAAMQDPMTLIIDHFESVTNWESWDVVATLALGLPPGSQLVIGSRDALPLPTALLRAQGGLFEVGVAELAMKGEEAAALLSRAGVEPAELELGDLVAHTEGWPTGLYLAALAARAGGSPAEAVRFTGDDRFMGDYLRSELLERVSSEQVAFLTRSAILESMCGPLCDAVVGTNGSGLVLEQLERRNLLVVPLDRRREWYRFHTMFRELLMSELRRREPEVVGDLHRRAAVWFESNGQPEIAVDHAQAAGDDDRVADLVLKLANPVWASGRSDTVLRWMEWFEANKVLERQPAIAVHGALMLRVVGPARDHRALGGGGRSRRTRVDAARRQHVGCHAGLPARPVVPRRAWRRCAATPSSPKPGWAPPARTAPRCSTPRGCRACSKATPRAPTPSSPWPSRPPRSRRAHRRSPSSSPSAASPRSPATTGRAPRRTPARCWR